jgi:CubicO group peptidase (beta-lactamase class C family)
MPHLTRATPSSRGIPDRALLDLLEELEAGGLDPHALVVTRHGDVVLETAWEPWDTDRASLVYSVSKTVTALAVGLLVGDGLLTLDDPVDAHLDLPNPHGLTVRHLLGMVTGHDREQTLAMPLTAEALLTTPLRHAPGGHFAYSSPASWVLSVLVTEITGERVGEVVRPRILEPLGIGARWWRRQGELDQGFSGLHLTALDLARLTLLVADRGRWRGRQLVPAAFVDEMIDDVTPVPVESMPLTTTGEPVTAGDWAHGYGLHLWRSRHGFRLDGAYGQLGVAVPDRGLVIGYLGASTDVQRALDAFWRLLDRLSDSGLEPVPDDASALERRASSLDAWDARDALVAGDAVDVSGWTLSDAGDAGPDGGWTLDVGPDLGGRRIDVPSARWSHGTLPLDDEVLVVAARGERLPDGEVRVHLAFPTSPHRVLLSRDTAGSLTAHWHTTPLWNPSPATLTVPRA